MVDLYLASRSPRRRALLAGLGLRFTVLDVEVDEGWAPGEPAARYVERMAREKALAGLGAADRVRAGAERGGAPVVVGADTIVVLDGEVLGKPRDGAEVLGHLERLSGRDHLVLSAVAVVSGADRPAAPEARLSRSRVWFRPLSPAERLAYRETGEPADKAGSYALQGLAAAFATRLEGSWSGVVGLPAFETVELLRRAGAPFLSGAARPAGDGTRPEGAPPPASGASGRLPAAGRGGSAARVPTPGDRGGD